MRNLKKILALVLALVMSLSLMMTASAATDFKDDGSIESYREAIEVLHGLGVFNGDQDGNFNPKSEITRAEVAAIIYRIATGDVTGDNKTSYSVYGNQFTDVLDEDWFAGYVSYCHNAGYIKGHGDGSFGPNEPVTGYQALAMILRAVGYDRNGEFTGDNWQINTASFATERGVLKNTAGAPLGANASRELVAEILFQSILLNKVNWNAITNSYTQSEDSLAKANLGMERLQGVVVANEYADLDSNTTLPDNRTRLDVEGTAYTLNIASGMEDLGESRYAYVKRTNNNTYDLVVAELYNTGLNQIKDNEGAPGSVSGVASGTSLAGAKYYIDFGEGNTYKASDYTIRYRVDLDLNVFSAAQQAGWLQAADKTGNSYKIEDDNGGRVSLERVEYKTADNKTDFANHHVYTKTIPFGDEITELDMSFIYTIFRNADKTFKDNTTVDTTSTFELGAVYVGTQSNIDISDTYSYNRFCEEYIDTDTGEVSFSSVERGNRLKVIDNNNDGKAEFVFKIRYTLDEIIDSVTKNDNTTWYFEHLADNHGYAIDWMDEYKPALNDVVLYNIADGKIHIQKAADETVTVNKVNFTNTTIDTTAGDTKNQSAITNGTLMDQDITEMDEKVEYIVYYDKYNNIRAYKLAQGNQYGLLTEVYGGTNYNGQFVQSATAIAELMGSEDKAPAEYRVLNHSAANWNVFYNPYTSTLPGAIASARPHYLQRAISHLGIVGTNYDYENRGTAVTSPLLYDVGASTSFTGIQTNGSEFGWNVRLGNTATNQAEANDYVAEYSWTNVAKYTKTDDGVNLYSASEWDTDRDNNYLYYSNLDGKPGFEKYTEAGWIAQYIKNTGATAAAAQTAFNNGLALVDGATPVYHVYAVDYVQLDIRQDVPTGTTRLAIDPNYDGYKWGVSGAYVNSVDATEYYLVTPGGVRHFVGRNNVPALLAANGDDIRAMYAVAHNVAGDQASTDYWVADVIVIELNDTGIIFEDVILGYWTGSKISRAYNQFVDSLSANEAETQVTVRPSDHSWAGQFNGYWAYGLSGTSKDEDGNIYADVTRINQGDYNKNGIYAGTITHVNELRNYVDVDLDGDNVSDDSWAYTNRFVYVIGNGGKTVNTVRMENLTGKQVILVENARGNLSFVVNVDYSAPNWVNPSWLGALWTDIVTEQGAQWLNDYAKILAVLTALTTVGGEDELTTESTEKDLQDAKKVRDQALDMIANPSNYGINKTQQDALNTVVGTLNGKINALEAALALKEAKVDAIEEMNEEFINQLKTTASTATYKDVVIDYDTVLTESVTTFTFDGSQTTVKATIDSWTATLDGKTVVGDVTTELASIKSKISGLVTAYLAELKTNQTNGSSNTSNKIFNGTVSDPVKTVDPDGTTNFNIEVTGSGVANSDNTNYSQLDTSKPLSVMALNLAALINETTLNTYGYYDITVANEALKDSGDSSVNTTGIKTIQAAQLADLADCYVLLKNGCDVRITIRPVNSDGSQLSTAAIVVVIDNNFTGTLSAS